MGVESQDVYDMDSFVRETLEHRGCWVVHITLLDATNTTLARELVSF